MQFRPGWKLSVFFILLLPCLLALGNWQLQRAQEKRDILAQIAERRGASATDIAGLSRLQDPAYVQVEARGQFVEGRTVLLDNQMYHGRFGYEVVNAFRSDTGVLLWVSRGWVAGSLRREELPQVDVPEGPIALQGEVYVPLGEAFTLEDSAMPAGWPKRVQVLDTARLAEALGESSYPYVIRLHAGTALALDAHWQDINVQPAKHTAYAVQWFAMAVALVLLYVAVATGILKSRQKVAP